MSIAKKSVSTGWRATFFVFDFLMPIGGVLGHLLSPKDSELHAERGRMGWNGVTSNTCFAAVLSGFIAKPLLPPAVETQVLLDGMAGWYAGLAGVHLWLQLYHPNNRAAWKPVIAQTILVDIGMLFAFARALNTQGILYDLSAWRKEDILNIIGYTAITLIRVAFLLKPSSSVRKDKKVL